MAQEQEKDLKEKDNNKEKAGKDTRGTKSLGEGTRRQSQAG
ncbi:MAG: hypothetical protein ACOCOO_04190 [Prevotella sp.]